MASHMNRPRHQRALVCQALDIGVQALQAAQQQAVQQHHQHQTGQKAKTQSNDHGLPGHGTPELLEVLLQREHELGNPVTPCAVHHRVEIVVKWTGRNQVRRGITWA